MDSILTTSHAVVLDVNSIATNGAIVTSLDAVIKDSPEWIATENH